jgi:hypothetical protein
MSPKQPKRKQLSFEITESVDFRIIPASGFFGGLGPSEGAIMIYTDYPEPGMQDSPGRMGAEKIIRQKQIVFTLSPATWKRMADWMMSHLKRLEKSIGTVPQEKDQSTTDSYIG